MRARVAAVLGCIFGALVLGAGAAAAEPIKVRIAWVVPIGNWASIIYEKKELMPHYGKSYVAEPVHFQATPSMITALATGEIDIADFAFSSFAIAVENAGMSDLKVIADEAQDGAHGYFSAEFFVLDDGPVKTIEDLKGKVLATVGVGSAVDIPARAMLRRHGLEDRRDYSVVEAGFPNMVAMLSERKIDFMPSVPPFAYDPRLLGIAHPLFTAKDALGGPTQFIVWTARAGFIAKNRAALVDLLEDTVRVVQYLSKPENHAEAVAIGARITHQPPANLDYIFTPKDDYHDPNLVPDLATFQRAIDTQQETGFLKSKLEVKDYADLSMVTEAAARIK
jgi:sulfonate transport system substrate-binding protein